MLLLNSNELNKLEHIESTLKKNVYNFMTKCGGSVIGTEIIAFHEKAEALRNEEICSLSESIQDLTRSLKSKVDLLKSQKMDKIRDFGQFKMEMVTIQESIINLKRISKSELLKLKSLENDLSEELDMFYNGKVAEWSKTVRISELAFIPHKIENKQSGPCKEVKQFFDFVHQSGGHENGWRKDDHLLFLKLRAKYKKVEELALQLHEILPDISVEEVQLHEEWFKKYLVLQSKKKAAINRWKQNKEGSSLINKEIARDKNVTDVSVGKEDCAKLKEKLMQWKIEKQEKLSTAREIDKLNLLDKIERERIKRQKQIEMKRLVNDWKESKMKFEDSQRQHQRICEELERKRRAAQANKLIKQFQSMDELHVLKKRQIQKKIDVSSKTRVQSGPLVRRDPKRLMQPTVQWAQRVRAFKEPSQGPIPVFATPKLGIPDWRKSIT